MDAKKWKALLLAVERGSFSKAAAELGYTQSGMTYLVNSLEEECGVSLLVRGWDGVRLSPEGEALLPDIHAYLDAETNLRSHLDAFSTTQEQLVRIGSYASLSVHWLAKCIAIFQQKNPNTTIELRAGTRQELYNWFKNDDVDVVFSDPLGLPSTEWTELYIDPLVAVLPKDHPAAQKSVFTPLDTEGFPFLMPPDAYTGGNPLRLRFARQANVRVRTEDDSVLLSMVAQGVGFSILPELTLRGRAENVVLLPLADPMFRRLGMLRKAGRGESRALRQLLAIMRANQPEQSPMIHPTLVENK